MAESRVTKFGVYNEQPAEGDGAVIATQFGVYAELARASEVRVTQAGAYAEMPGQPAVLATQFGVYLELRPLKPVKLLHHEYEPGPPPYDILPEPLTGYALDGAGSFWSVIAPEATTNLLPNPSFEPVTTLTFNAPGFYQQSGWSATPTRVNTRATAGNWCLRMMPALFSNGVLSFKTAGFAFGQVQTFSFDIYQSALERYEIRVTDDVAVKVITRKTWQAGFTGWFRQTISFVNTNINDKTLSLVSVAGNREAIFTDRWQLENKAYPTTYVDGDMRGFSEETDPYAYAWLGTPHASESTRSANTRTGGRAVALDKMKFRTIGIQGLGMTQVDPQFELLDPGERLRRVVRPGREFTIIGKLFGCRYEELQSRRQELISLLRPRWLRDVQPLLLQYHNVDSRGRVSSPTLQIAAVYREGLGLSLNNLHQETLTLNFRAGDPLIYEAIGDGVKELGYLREDDAHAGFVRINGNWQTLGDTPFTNGDVNAVCYANGQLVIGGAFTAVGTTIVNYLSYWDGTDWTIMGLDGLNNQVNGLAAAYPFYSTSVAVVGTFTQTGGGIGTLRRAVLWNPDSNTFTELATGLNGPGLVVVPWRSADYFVGGNFTQNGPGTQTLNYIAWRQDATTTWTVLAHGGLNGPVFAMIVGDDGYLYVGGDFTHTSDSALTLRKIARYEPYSGTWESFSAGFNGAVRALAFGPDGLLYAGGDFTADFLGNNMDRLARWNGVTWEEVGGGLDQAVTNLFCDGEFLYVNGNFFAGQHGLPTYCQNYNARWTGDQWVPSDFLGSGGTAAAKMFAQRPDGQLAAAPGVATLVRNAAGTTVTYDGTAEVRPTFSFSANGTLYQISNLTTGQHLFFKALTLIDEILTVDLSGDRPRIYTNARGDLTRFVMPMGGNTRDFRLAEGDNHIVVHMLSNGEAIQAFMRWPSAHYSIDVAATLR